MRLDDVSLIGAIHGLACILALIAGGWNIVTFDRGANHRLRGAIYVWSMIAANLLVFVIYDFDIDFASGRAGAGIFGFFHYLAISALVFTAIGWLAAYRQRHGVWAYVHPISMTLGYYVLIGGLINEAFARIDALRPLSYTMTEQGPRFGSSTTGMTQSAAMLATLLLIILFIVRVGLRRRKLKQRRAAPSSGVPA
ncbi:MAG TPA: hypothetical protein VGO52_17040 [Hyphomonadaceae bacterium]|jgi:hypothetical protein|nr:hypothetical protein [Hyphomonadaceae bacterium]